MTFADCHELFQKLDVSWHRELGMEGNFNLSNFESELMLSVVSYKRICDCIEEELGKDELFDGADIDRYEEAYKYGMISYEYPAKARWDYVISQNSTIRALKEAIEIINEINFKNIAYGDKLIPEFSYAPVDANSLNIVSRSWIAILKNVSLDKGAMDDDTWGKLSKFIRSKIT